MPSSEDRWHAMSIEAVTGRQGVDPASGLSEEVAHNRFLVFGPNRVSPCKDETIWEIFLEEIREPMIVLLLITGALYAIWGEFRDTLTRKIDRLRRGRDTSRTCSLSARFLGCRGGGLPLCAIDRLPLFRKADFAARRGIVAAPILLLPDRARALRAVSGNACIQCG